MDYSFGEKRKKKKDKYKEKKKHPYKAGGKYRVVERLREANLKNYRK